MTNEEKMEFTINYAREGMNNGEMPIAASIWLGDKLVSKANTTENKDKKLLVHAELRALLEADNLKSEVSDRKKMKLFTSLEPYLMCYGAAMSAYIGEIYFSLKAPEDGALSLIRFEKFNNDYLKFQNPEIEGGILIKMGKEVLLDYMKLVEKNSWMYNFSKKIVEIN